MCYRCEEEEARRVETRPGREGRGEPKSKKRNGKKEIGQENSSRKLREREARRDESTQPTRPASSLPRPAVVELDLMKVREARWFGTSQSRCHVLDRIRGSMS